MEIDFKSVKALSSPTRVKILNRILEKEATPTRLSEDLDKSKSTISSHLRKLKEAKLAEKDEEEGRKRVVYRPTRKAEAIVKGKERKVKFSIASAALSFAVGATLVSTKFIQGMFSVQSKEETAGTMGTMSQEAAETAAREPASLVNLSADIFLVVGLGFLGISVLGFLYGITIKKLADN